MYILDTNAPSVAISIRIFFSVTARKVIETIMI